MDRKLALATAAVVVLTASAGTAAVAANLGLLSSTPDDTVGQLQPTRDEQPTTEIVVVEEVVPGATTAVDDDGYDDDGYDDEHEEDEDHEEDDDEHDEEEDDDGHDDDD